jgi:hypothetical protein
MAVDYGFKLRNGEEGTIGRIGEEGGTYSGLCQKNLVEIEK